MKKVRSAVELVPGGQYRYGTDGDDKEQIFKLDDVYVDLIENEMTAQLNYRDGYVANIPFANLLRHVDEGKVYKPD